jgi:hypothetical protein
VFREPRNLVLRIEKKLHEQLAKAAKARSVTISDLVRPVLDVSSLAANAEGRSGSEDRERSNTRTSWSMDAGF